MFLPVPIKLGRIDPVLKAIKKLSSRRDGRLVPAILLFNFRFNVLINLDGADLSDADLGGVEGLTQGQLNRVNCNSGTKLPMGLIGMEDAER